MESHNIHYLNTFFRNNKDFGRYLERVKNIYLPKLIDGVATTSYLMKAARGEVFTLSRDKLRNFNGEIQPITRFELNELLFQESGMPTGFENHSLPNKKWLLDCLYSINPDHDIFRRGVQPEATVEMVEG